MLLKSAFLIAFICVPHVAECADEGNENILLNAPYFKALTAIESVVVKYEFTHPVADSASKQGMKSIVTIVDFEWSNDGLLYFARPKIKADAAYRSPYHQFVCFHNGRQLYSLSTTALGSRAWDMSADVKRIADHYAKVVKEPPALPEEVVKSVRGLYTTIYNGFFAVPNGPAIVAPPFLLPGQYLLFSDGINPSYNFLPGIMGKHSLLAAGIPFFRNDQVKNVINLTPFYRSRNADFWSETIEASLLKSGIPSDYAVVLTPKTGGATTRRIAVCQLSPSAGVSAGNECLRIDAAKSGVGAGFSAAVQWRIELKALSVNDQKPTFISEGSDLSRYQSILDLDTGMTIEP